jgi:phosphocarrier protein HPr
MIKTSTTISNRLGLHARASAKLTKLAGSFPCEVWISRGERRVNAKSIMGVMMLAAGIGSEVTLETHGDREQEANGRLAGPHRRQVWGRRVTFSVPRPGGRPRHRHRARGAGGVQRVDVAHYFIMRRRLRRRSTVCGRDAMR